MFVAPYVGAWIETDHPPDILDDYESHPTWVRGLKRSRYKADDSIGQSHPTWVRGLKPANARISLCIFRRTLRGCVD